MNKIKKHFEAESNAFDRIIMKLIPYYHQMLEALILSIPFKPAQKIHVVDLGCGTGTVAKLIKDNYVNSTITCVDFSENMIAAAKEKLIEKKGIDYIVEDFNNLKFDRKYDVVISSLAIHHIVMDRDKKKFYRKIFQCLNHGGVFFNADNILGSNHHLQNIFIKKWIEFMRNDIPQKEIDHKWLPKHKVEDSPSELVKQIKWLEEIGFIQTDVIWKYYNFAVFGGYKR
jgi:tRNA (cmo5U34)-methyltransferase